MQKFYDSLYQIVEFWLNWAMLDLGWFGWCRAGCGWVVLAWVRSDRVGCVGLGLGGHGWRGFGLDWLGLGWVDS